MRKDQQEALQRLEQALLEADPPESAEHWEKTEETADTWLEATYRQNRQVRCDAYNTDSTDVDMGHYSSAVMDAPKKKPRGRFLLLILLSGLLIWFLRKWGII